MITNTGYGLSAVLRLPFADAVQRTRDALAKEGFGVLTEIDVRATFRKKLDVEFRPYVILGACHPPLAYRALTAEPELGLLLPCNVVVQAGEHPGESIVSMIDPLPQFKLTGRPDLEAVAHDVRERLVRVLEGVSAG